MTSMRVLKLDAYGTPTKWINIKKAAFHLAKGDMVWTHGDIVATIHGGHNKHGEQSVLEIPSIIAVKGHANRRGRCHVGFSKDAMVIRDRGVCAYCGKMFSADDLTMDHVIPRARNGRLTWTNTVSACGPCNHRKGCRTPEEANMPLLYVPYIPDRYEGLILSNRNILADQMEFLMAGVPRNSRLKV